MTEEVPKSPTKRGRPPKIYGLTKPCTSCGIDKLLDAFGWSDKSKGIRTGRCRACLHIKTVEYRKRNPDKVKVWKAGYRLRNRDKVRAQHRNWRLGEASSEYQKLSEQQSRLCAICKNPERVLTKLKGPKALSYDHNHETDLLRGLLCNRCNIVLGFVEDDVELLQEIIHYLQKWKESHLTSGGLSFLEIKRYG